MMGAAHSMEIPFVFGRFEFFGGFDRFFFTRRNEAGRVDLSNRMMRHWANFARDGAPGAASDGSLWTRFSQNPAQASIKIFDAPGGGGARMQAGQETQTALVGELFKDQTLKDDAQRCAVFRTLRDWNEEMVGMDGGRCAR
jgi:para-nitrobenzyl esterase